MKANLSFAQRLQRASLSNEKSVRATSTSIEKTVQPNTKPSKTRYMQFKQQHNELQSMLRLFQGSKSPQLDNTSQLMPVTPVRPRIGSRKNINKTPVSPLNSSKLEAVKENFRQSQWPISLTETNKSNASLLVIKTTSHIAQQRSILTPKTFQKAKKKGIPNIGNTCYINAIVQCLFHLPHFNAYFADQKYIVERNDKSKDVVKIYRELYMDIMQNSQKVDISTLPLKKSVSKICMLFIDWQQEDAHQFMKELINSIHEDLNRIKIKPKYRFISKELEGEPLQNQAAAYWDFQKQRDDSYIYDSFCGQVYNNIRCITCNHQSQCFQNFLDLSIPIIQHRSSLEELLAQFFQPEKLSDFYLCSHCNKSSKKSVKTVQLWRVPRFLIIHLKRSQFGKKNTEPITIPQNLTLKPYMTISKDKSARYCQYNLCGIIMHQGVIQGGHYWCTVKESGKWYQLDDEKVKQLNTEEFKTQISKKGSSNAYILFYSSLYS